MPDEGLFALRKSKIGKRLVVAGGRSLGPLIRKVNRWAFSQVPLPRQLADGATVTDSNTKSWRDGDISMRVGAVIDVSLNGKVVIDFTATDFGYASRARPCYQ